MVVYNQTTDAMLSVMTPSQPFIPRRPKLSLQTALPPAPISQIQHQTNLDLRSDNASPTVQNTYSNAFDVPLSISSLPACFRVECFPHHVNTDSTIKTESSHAPPFHQNVPYAMAIGTKSILRNSPIPRPYLHARRPRIFPTIKRVSFRTDVTPEIIPTQEVDADALADARTVENIKTWSADFDQQADFVTRCSLCIDRPRSLFNGPVVEAYTNPVLSAMNGGCDRHSPRNSELGSPEDDCADMSSVEGKGELS